MSSVHMDTQGLDKLAIQLKELSRHHIVFGLLPSHAERREPEPDEEKIDNLSLAITHEFGDPAKNIPARPFLRPGVDKAREEIISKVVSSIQSVIISGNVEEAIHELEEAGKIGVSAMREVIMEGIPPPLKDFTIRHHLRLHGLEQTRVGAAIETDRRTRGEVSSVDYATPLVMTGQLIEAIDYEIRRG